MSALAGQPFLRYNLRWSTLHKILPSGPRTDTTIDGEVQLVATLACQPQQTSLVIPTRTVVKTTKQTQLLVRTLGNTSLMKRAVASRSCPPPSHELHPHTRDAQHGRNCRGGRARSLRFLNTSLQHKQIPFYVQN